jgi:hypothetical protein
MPTVVICPKCKTKLSAPDAALGKNVRCVKPLCGTIVPVPAFVPAEVVEVVEASLQPPKPSPEADERDTVAVDQRKRNSQSEEDEKSRPQSKRRLENDGDDEDERPRRRGVKGDDDEHDNLPRPRRRQKKSRWDLGVGLIVAIVFGMLLVVGALGYGIYSLVEDVAENMRTKAPPPRGWQEFTYRTDKFKVCLPQAPSIGSLDFGGKQPFANMGVDIQYPEAVSTYLSDQNSVSIFVVVARYKSRLSSKDRNQSFSNVFGNRNIALKDARTVRWLGVSADEVANPAGVTRVATVGSTVYMAAISNGRGLRAKPEEENGFFDSFKLLD